MNTRRAFIRFLAASPLYAGLGHLGRSFAETPGSHADEGLIARVGDALDVFDFEPVAHRNIPPAHWGYLVSGVDGEDTLRANRDAYSHYQLQARRMVDVSKIDTSLELFGTKFNSPIILCPLGAQKAFHPGGEIAVAKAANARGHLQMLSTVTSTGVEDVIAARGAPVWFQLYTTSNLYVAAKLVKRAEAAGCPAVAVTVDLAAGRDLGSALRFGRRGDRTSPACPAPTGSAPFSRPMFAQLDTAGLAIVSSSLQWASLIQRPADTTMKIIITVLASSHKGGLAMSHAL